MDLLSKSVQSENITNKKSIEIKLLWTNPEGIEIDLNDPVAFQKELDDEKLRYRIYLQNRFLTDEIVYNNAPPSQKAHYTILMQKLKDRANLKGTSLAIELKQTIYKHMEAYKGKLKKERNKLAAEANIDNNEDNTIWYHKTTAYDISTEEGAIAYINRMTLNHLGRSHTPERLKTKLEQLKKEVLPKLKNIDCNDIAKKLNKYISTQIASLENGTIPKELQQARKKPTLIKQVRNKNYDISNKYAFGTYLSFSHRDILNQNPGMSEDEARLAVCNNVIADLQKEPINPTTTTAIKQLEKIIDSPTDFYNFIHAKRLANVRSAEKRKEKRKQKLSL